MTKEQLLFYIETETVFEFSFNGIVYNMTFDKDKNGKKIIIFGRLYEGEKYLSTGDLLNNAKIENHFFKEMLDVITPNK